MANFLKKLFGSSNEAEIKRLRKILDKVNALEPKMHALRDEELQRVSFEVLLGCEMRCEVRRRSGKSYVAKIYRHDAVLPQKRDKSLIITDLGGVRL